MGVWEPDQEVMQ